VQKEEKMIERYTAPVLQQAIMNARPWNLTALILRISNLFPKIQQAFMELVEKIDDLPDPVAHLYNSLHELGKEVEWWVRVIVYLAEKIVPNRLANAVLRFVINVILIPYFEIVNEKAFIKTKEKFEKDGSQIILDIVGEAAKTEEDAEQYMKSYEYVIREFGGKMAVKPSSLIASSTFEKNTYEQNKELLKEKFARLFTAAKGRSDVEITTDAEEYFDWCRLTEEAFLEAAMDERFRNMSNEPGIALQTYRKDALASAHDIINTAFKRGSITHVRVVKGAYWNDEHKFAMRIGKDCPVHETQEETNAMFNEVVALLMKYRKYIHVSVATHNAKNIAYAINQANGDYTNFDFEVLTGMGESIRRVLRDLGVPVSVYCPLIRKCGTPKEGMRYLIRRLDEVAKSSHVLKNV